MTLNTDAGALLLVAILIGCGATTQPASTAADAADAADVADIMDAGPEVAPEPDVVVEPDVAPEPPPDPMEGAPPGWFDCSNPSIPPARLANAPVTCPIEAECTDRLVVAHRASGGFGLLAPENSRAAIRAALWMGVDGVELDVRHTSDDVLVVMHDAELDRTTGVSAKVSDLTAAEIGALPLLPTNELGQTIDGDFTCETVPTLAEAFALTRDRLFVDLDTKTSRIDLVVAAIVEADLVDQVFVSVSNANRAAEARALEPSIRVQVRPDTLEELAEVLALFPDRPPEIVEVPETLVATMAPPVIAAGATVFTNAFGQDVVARLVPGGGDYLGLWEQGAQILQADFTGVALDQLGRWPPPAE